MEVAYLIKQVRNTHAILLPNRDVDQTGLLRARTYLAFLQSKRVLKQEDRGNWERIYYDASASFVFDKTAFDDPNVVAAIAYLPFTMIWDQPGVAIVKKTEDAALFTSVYLKSSITWLNAVQNHSKLEEIEQHFSQGLSKA